MTDACARKGDSLTPLVSPVHVPFTTRGAILQRHKIEWKDLRKTLDGMKHSKMHMRHAKLDGKADKKALGKEIKRLQQEWEDKCKQELADFDQHEAEAKAKKEAASGDSAMGAESAKAKAGSFQFNLPVTK